ncbi:MAG TPA: XdhC family protein [Acidimicrobiales bacterium]|nr:XdhC family protein [Acidimicrobiales bacterium]
MNPEIESRAAALRQERVPFVHARVVRAERPTSAKPGDQAVVLPDGSIEGFVGGACAESTVRAQSLSLLDSGEPLLLRISPAAPAEGVPGAASDAEDPPGTLSVVNHCLSGGTLEIFLEPVVPAPVVAVHGESPIAAALVSLADGVGFHGARGAVAPPMDGPDGPAAVVVASHGRDEEHIIEAAVRAGVPYVGLVASRKRGDAVLASLDLDEGQRASVHTPAGLDIGARTPREVALSILAEIIASRPRVSGAPAPARALAGPASEGSGSSGSAESSDDVEAPASAASGPVTVTLGRRPDVEIDLVCGMSVVADEESLHLDHAGHRYWFCGSGCLRAFAADPGAYLSADA